MKVFKRMSRENQKLLYWLLECYAYNLANVDITNKSAEKKPRLKGSVYWKFKAKEDLKKFFLKAEGKELKKARKISDRLRERIENNFEYLEDRTLTKENKVNLFYADMEEFFYSELQSLSLILDGTFSLALHLMSNENAVKFTEFLYEYFIDHSIPMWSEIETLYKEQNYHNYVFMHFKHCQCLICHQYADQVHHVEKVAGVGGRKYDTYDLERMPLCTRHHSEVESIGEITFNYKYLLEGGIVLTEQEYEIIKDKYPGHFKQAEKNRKKKEAG